MTPRRAKLVSPAKINLALRVLHRRADGYHELRTIFQTISLADLIEVEHVPARRFSVHVDSTPEIPDNLIARAANALHDRARISGAWNFRVEKRVPLGAGLGGGSSNAAAALLAMPVLAGKRVSLETLMKVGGWLGSDVPFFLLGGAAVGIGRGAEVYPLDGVPAAQGILVTPRVHVSTAEAYARLGRRLTIEPRSSILNSFQRLAWRADECVEAPDWAAVNDFETPVFERHPKLRAIRNQLRSAGAAPALMSGSGSSVFGLFADREARDAALRRIEALQGKDAVHSISFLNQTGYRALWRRQLRAHIKGKAWPPQSRYCP